MIIIRNKKENNYKKNYRSVVFCFHICNTSDNTKKIKMSDSMFNFDRCDIRFKKKIQNIISVK